jgi:hypothetical protein
VPLIISNTLEDAALRVAMAKHANPNNSKIPTWLAYDANTRATMIFDKEVRLENDPRSEIRKFWADMPSAVRYCGLTVRCRSQPSFWPPVSVGRKSPIYPPAILERVNGSTRCVQLLKLGQVSTKMRSHTVPMKLLKRFAYDDPVTRSKRLWRYQKEHPPYGNASPKTATRRNGHFADPTNAAKEAEIEERLERQFEHPVNQFIEDIEYRTFVLQPGHIRVLTGYITMLFGRSRARQTASKDDADRMAEALRALLSNDHQLSELAGKFTIDAINRGLVQAVTKEEVVAVIERTIAAHDGADQPQSRYILTMDTMMRFVDLGMLNGYWQIIRAEPDKPFVIGDAPVVTWERTSDNSLYYGLGFARPNVEIFLPMSPTACLHVLPKVQRTRLPVTPTTNEVNRAQAAFASEHCYTNIFSPEIDAELRPLFGMIRIGVEGFSVSHIDYKKLLFDILMDRRVPAA